MKKISVVAEPSTSSNTESRLKKAESEIRRKGAEIVVLEQALQNLLNRVSVLEASQVA
jgi:hypothetical protein